MERKGLNYIHGIIGVVLAFAVLFFGGYILVPIFGQTGALLVGTLMALIALVITFISRTKLKEVFPIKLPSVRELFGSMIIYAGTMMVSSSISLFIGRIFDAEQRDAAIDSVLLKINPMLALLLVAVLPALCEEFFCRGFLVRCLDKIKNEKIVILIIAVVFGALHLDFYSFIPTALSGAVFCFVAIRSKSLFMPILLHFCNNALAVSAVYAITPDDAEEAIDVFSISLPQTFGMAALYLGLGILPLVLGYLLFTGKKVFCKKSLIALLLSIALFIGGLVGFIAASYSYGEKVERRIELRGDDVSKVSIVEKVEIDTVFFIGIESYESVYITVVVGKDEVYSAYIDGKEIIPVFLMAEDGPCYVTLSAEYGSDGETQYVTVNSISFESVLEQ